MMTDSNLRRGAASALILAVLAGCHTMDQMMDPPPPTAPARIFSPNGEPLRGGPLGHPTCREAMARWFDRVDANHDGVIDRGEFRADAERQFKIMDLDHDGEITPDELARYRAPYEVDTARRETANGAEHGERIVRMVEQADPVMLADTKLRNRVSLADFLAYADGNFADLDRHHDGRLTKAELQDTCGPEDKDR
jgi:Ca2+-binding EF-hand superfamily protein